MRKTAEETFNREVDGYRKALLYHARCCSWDAFEAKAGGMFDYIESVEQCELEQRFFSNFWIILGALVLTTVALVTVPFEVSPALIRMKSTMTLAAVAASTFELFFYVNFRTYVGVRASRFGERRKNFIVNIERDFREYVRKREDGRE